MKNLLHTNHWSGRVGKNAKYGRKEEALFSAQTKVAIMIQQKAKYTILKQNVTVSYTRRHCKQ
jgi:hypothetical protein